MDILRNRLNNKFEGLSHQAVLLPRTNPHEAIAIATKQRWTVDYLLQERLRSGQIVTHGTYSMSKLLEYIDMIWIDSHPPELIMTPV